MGAIVSCLGSCLAGCACSACSTVAGSIAQRSARLAYCGLFAFSLIIAWILRECSAPLMKKISWINDFSTTPSDEWFAAQAVMRVCLANFLFFATHAAIMVKVKYQNDVRNAWHHGGWMIKFIIWIILMVLMFFLPNGFIYVFETLSKFGSGLFLLVQVIILLDFTHSWNDAWVAKDTQFWYTSLLVISLLFYAGAFTLSGLLFYWFNPNGCDCQLNIAFIVITMIMCVAFAVISLHPKVNGSLLPASTISIYCAYLCYSGLSSEPGDYKCNGLHKHSKAVSTGTLVLGMLITTLSVVYSAVRAGSSTTFLSPPSSPRMPSSPKAGARGPLLLSKSKAGDLEGNKEEGEPVTYVYSFFYIIFALASMYSAMLLTGWTSANSEKEQLIDVGWPSVWVRICTQWITGCLFIWSLLAPLIITDRDFD